MGSTQDCKEVSALIEGAKQDVCNGNDSAEMLLPYPIGIDMEANGFTDELSFQSMVSLANSSADQTTFVVVLFCFCMLYIVIVWC